ncbi:MAG: NAD(P)H-dependent flavin oxidoreductase [Alkaliphilus sp.]
MILKPLKIGKKTTRIPIIQGGMGVGVSLSKLASAVANEGGIGVISAVQIGFREFDFETNNDEANVRAFKKEIREARRLSPEGTIGVNILVAVNNFKEMVKAAVEEKADLIIAGAGLPTELPALVKGSDTKIAPIVSSGKVASLITKVWKRRYNYSPDLVIVEGPEAGGHLGFSMEQFETGKTPELADIVQEVIESLKSYGENIPVIAAGGIFDGADIVKHLKIGAAGVQIATRFVATHECDAAIKFKQAYIDAKKEDIQLVKSPVGMPGRALRNDFVRRLEKGNIAIEKCSNCLRPCNASTSLYCISKALINAVVGKVDAGLIFVGSNVYRLNKIVSVKVLIDELLREVYNESSI